MRIRCGTGATTHALPSRLKVRKVVGVDPNGLSLRVARARWVASQSDNACMTFDAFEPNQSLPFADNSFDLTKCLSDIKFLGNAHMRVGLACELLRKTKLDDHVCLATPRAIPSACSISAPAACSAISGVARVIHGHQIGKVM